jgi:hypothetical protein
MAAKKKAPVKRGPGKGEGPKVYFVWIVNYVKKTGTIRPVKGEPGPYGPFPLWNAKTYARIGATKGKHHRAVTRGWDVNHSSFKLVRVYEGGTGIKLFET